jgi:hypothetical protein
MADSEKRLLALCESWEQEGKNRWRSSQVCDEKKEGPVSVKQAFQSTAIIYCLHASELRAAIQPKFSLEFLFKIFRTMEHTPGINSLMVFCAALDDLEPMREVLAPLGGMLIGEEEVKLLLWAKEYHRAKDARIRMRKLEMEL